MMDLAALVAARVTAQDAIDVPPRADATWPRTLPEAIAGGFDAIVAAHLNTVGPTVPVARGVVAAADFLRDLTPAMAGALSSAEAQLLDRWLAAGIVDTTAPAIEPVLARIAYPVTRAGSHAEQALGSGARVVPDEIAALDLDGRSARVRVGLVKEERIASGEKVLTDGRIVGRDEELLADGTIRKKTP